MRVEHSHAQRSFKRDLRWRVNRLSAEWIAGRARSSAGTRSLVRCEYAADQNGEICLLRKPKPRHEHCASDRYKRLLQNNLTAEVFRCEDYMAKQGGFTVRAPTLALLVVQVGWKVEDAVAFSEESLFEAFAEQNARLRLPASLAAFYLQQRQPVEQIARRSN